MVSKFVERHVSDAVTLRLIPLFGARTKSSCVPRRLSNRRPSSGGADDKLVTIRRMVVPWFIRFWNPVLTSSDLDDDHIHAVGGNERARHRAGPPEAGREGNKLTEQLHDGFQSFC